MNAQRMTEEETQAVIRLWQGEQPGVADAPTLSDVAEGLNISVKDTHRLLLQVRARRAEEERLLSQEQAASDLEQGLFQEAQDLAAVRRQRAELRRLRTDVGMDRHSPPRRRLSWGTVIFVVVMLYIVFSIVFRALPH